MKNHNLRIIFKNGKQEIICHVDAITFDKRFPKDMAIASWGLITYIDTDKIERIETTTAKYETSKRH